VRSNGSATVAKDHKRQSGFVMESSGSYTEYMRAKQLPLRLRGSGAGSTNRGRTPAMGWGC
jgi:hypothetical protein